MIDEVFKVRVKAEQGEKKIVEDTTKMQKMISDLEACINTSIITEKSELEAQSAATKKGQLRTREPLSTKLASTISLNCSLLQTFLFF